VDALDGSVLFRFNELRYQVCNTSGQITGDIYEYLPETNITPIKVVKPFAHETVFVGDVSNAVKTGTDGKFCTLATGKIFTALQGPYANVANFMTVNAHYDNGGGEWTPFSSVSSSPHPYPNNAVIVSTINAPSGAQGACPGGRDPVKVIPNFDIFKVGTLSPEADITDSDYVEVIDSTGNPVAVYVGNKTAAFRGAAVAGRTLRLRLTTSEAGQFYGYDVSVSSYLCLKNQPTLSDHSTSSFTWTSTRTYSNTNDEVSLFYHVNKAHDYFMGGPNFSSSAYISRPIPVMAHLGPGINNAFYDPVGKFLAFGDVMDFTKDGSIIYHEYVHYVVDQIYPILNFGQNGAISEALSDYFTASAMNTSKIGAYVSGGGEGSLRNIDSTLNGGCSVVSPPSNCTKFPANWTGELHLDSLILSEPLWEIRQALAGGSPNGNKCADQLVFRSLFFFPDNFRDFLEAMLQVSARASTLAPSCLGSDQHTGLILGQFAQHGITELPRDQEDAYEPNDGVQSATDITTSTVISARVYPAADMDYFSLGVGAGPLKLTLTLPESPSVPGTHFAYEVILIDKAYNLVKEVMPNIDINPAIGSGLCPNGSDPCLTSQGEVVLEYNVPSSGQYYVLVAAGLADYMDYASNGNTNSPQYYTLKSEYNRTGPIAIPGITASYDNDGISFQAGVSVFGSTPVYSFHHARLRDHALSVLPETDTSVAGSYLMFVSSSLSISTVANVTVTNGILSGRFSLKPGFARRFPAVGTVHVEIFGENQLAQYGAMYHHPISLGFSSPLNLTARESSLTAWNNVFNPAQGEKATFKYETTEAGHIRLRLFTMSGALVRTVVDSDLPAGKGSVDWDGTNSGGSRVASGIYYLHLDAPGGSRVQKVIVVK
jgi:hypothetical protein